MLTRAARKRRHSRLEGARMRNAEDGGQDRRLENIFVGLRASLDTKARNDELVDGEALGERHAHGATPFAREEQAGLALREEILQIRQSCRVRLQLGDGDDGERLRRRGHEEVDVEVRPAALLERRRGCAALEPRYLDEVDPR